jgi:hypothetical protein
MINRSFKKTTVSGKFVSSPKTASKTVRAASRPAGKVTKTWTESASEKLVRVRARTNSRYKAAFMELSNR